MANRDNHSLVIGRQSILLVTAVGVGLLTLTYVLGVQVGKQSSAVRQALPRGAGESLSALPAPIQDQLKGFERPPEKTGAPAPEAAAPGVPGAGAPPAPAAGIPAATAAGIPAAAAPPPAAAPAAAPAEADRKAAAKATEAPKATEEAPKGPRWTLQFMSTPDPREAQRLAARLKAAGFPATVVREKGINKVRLVKGGPRDSLDKAARSLKDKGFKPFAVKAE
jgi:cell division protein FtsN